MQQTKIMKCPICNNEMVLKGKDLTEGQHAKRYDRTIYNCEDCDTWMTQEVPQVVTETAEE